MNKRFHRKDVAAIMDKAGRSYIELKYNLHMEELRNLYQNAFNYVIDAVPHKWSRVHCPERRYRLMTKNVTECINSCLKITRQLPMLTLAEFIRNMLQGWFHDRHHTVQSIRHQLTDVAHLVILKRVDKYGYMTVYPVDWNIFSMKQSGKQWNVDLARKTCTCNKFQIDMFPCSHALATARERNLDYKSLCADFYKRQTLIDACSVPIMHVGHPSSWIIPTNIVDRVVLNPLSRRQAGHPGGGGGRGRGRGATCLVFEEDNHSIV
ncbi:hypothetical protein Ddye_025498 [Dipteronia dyeriana]|uniref:SWIM-type domain-containing protein n=1 Tax=Dipteronia dyeriana TaxID=168575 RepID=A0AAD9TLB3_9ROSI|nr:hypothetical protein Ddye_025498 [Dipteronia dyeriana]